MTNLNKNIFRAYDIRGIAHIPDPGKKTPDLTPEITELIGRASGVYFKGKYGKKIAVTRDCRLSNPEISDAFIKGLCKAGCDVTEIGMTPTPMLYFTVCKFGFDGGAAITASHNPKEYNGIKLVSKNAHSICGESLLEIYEIAKKNKLSEKKNNLSETENKNANDVKKMEELDIFPAYTEDLTALINLEKTLKIVVDSGNGAAGPYVKTFFSSLGCDVMELYSEPDGNFPNHPANPEETKNMSALIEKVVAEKADLGIGFDGDGDRVGIIDEKGNHYNADLLLLLLARDLLSRKPGSKIVFDVKASRVLIDDIKKHGGIPVMEKTGHSFIESKMREISAPLGGEISGHMFFAENYYGFDDAFLAAGKLLEILSKSDKTFSEIMENIPKTESTPEIKCACPDEKKFEVVQKLTAHFTKIYDCVTIDGVRINFDKESWGAVRASNTSPNLTIRFEAQNNERLKEIVDIMLKQLKKFPEINLKNFDAWN